MSNIIDSIQLSGVTYTLSAQTSGEGKSVEAGRGISVASGTSAYTVSFNLPISAGTGSNSVAEGAGTTASGICSHAEGYYTQARGDNSHAEGQGTIASGNYSHAEGYQTRASSNYSHAEGNTTFTDGSYSHAEGNYTIASGNYSHAEGNNTVTNNQSEHASGQYNVSNNANNTFGNSGNTLFSVGNGTSYNARHNAFEIRQNGDIYLSSGGTDIKLQDHLGGGNPTVELTQAEYDALVSGGTVDPTAFYIITDATPVDMSQYWTSAQTNSAINAAVSGKQDTLSAGTGIDITNNVISVTGGGGGEGKAVEAGRGIDVASGTSAYTVSFNLPISAGTGQYSIIEGYSTSAISYSDHAEGFKTYANGNGYAAHAEGYQTSAMTFSCHAEGSNTKANGNDAHAEGNSTVVSGKYSHAEGRGTTASGNYSHTEGYNTSASSISNVDGITIWNGYDARHAEGAYALANNASTHVEGFYNIANNFGEHASGTYNVSSSASTTFGNSGNTLFSVGNGTSTSARHNAFEIRQNGDIYLSLNGQDVKLQDQLGGSSITVDTELDSGSTNPVENRVIYNKIDEVEQVTAAALNNINDTIGNINTILESI